MATITLNIPDAQINRVVTDICGLFGYQATINGQPNPQTPNQFAKQQLINFVMNACIAYENQAALSATTTSTTTNVTTNVTIT